MADWSMGWGADDDDEDVASGFAPWRHGKPDNEVPAVLAIEQVLAQSDGLVFFLAGLRVYRAGVEFDLEARLRPGADLGDYRGVWELVDGHRSRDRLLIGVEFADGRRCANLEGPVGSGDGVSLSPGHSGGGGRSASATYFLHPLPAAGDLRIYCALPAVGVAETVTVLDGSLIHEAAQRVRVLWPWEPERHAPAPPAPPVLPDGGWFASFAGQAKD